MAMKLALAVSLIALQCRAEFFQILRGSLEKDAQLREARLGVQTARLGSLRAKGEFFPSLSAYTTASTEDYPSHGTNATASGARLQYDLLRFGRDYYNLKASRRELSRAKTNVAKTYIERESSRASLLLEIARQARNLEILESIKDLKARASTMAKKRYNRGLLSQDDFRRVRIDLKNASSSAQEAKMAWLDLKTDFETYLPTGTLPTTYPWAQAEIEKIFAQLKEKDFEQEEIPSVRSLATRVEELDFEQKALTSAMFGNLNLTLAREKVAGDHIDEQWAWKGSVTLSLPLFNQFKDYAAKEQKKVEVLGAKAYLRQEKNAAVSRYKNSRLLLAVSRNSLKERREALQLAQKVYATHLNLFNQGKISVNDLLIEQDRLLQTKQLINQGLFQFHSRAFSLCHALGLTLTESCFRERL